MQTSRPSARLAGAALTALTLLAGSAAAQEPTPAPAQTPPAPAPETQPAPPPPGRYPPPPPPVATAPHFPYAPPPELAEAPGAPDDEQDHRLYRPFSFTVAVGPGGLFGPGEDALAVSYNLFRLGFGLAPRLSFVFAYEGAGADSENPSTGADSWLQQRIWTLGIQYHLLSRLYLRGAVGFGQIDEHTDDQTFSGGNGLSLGAAAGVELLQAEHVAVGLEASLGTTHYPRERWNTAGLHLTLAFF